MQSLRTRRQSEARPAKGQNRLTKTPGLRDARTSTRVDDKIKKRMSMRYADISAPTNAEVPPMPSLPIGLRAGVQRDQGQPTAGAEPAQPKEDPALYELKLLDKDDFDPDAYLKLKLANSTEAEIKSLQSSLRTQKDNVAVDLQRNVFKNYAEFVLVSKEVSTLENEMLEFKESLSEWKSMPSLLHIDESASVAERRRNVRSSIADLRVLYANQMQTLHSQIEGSSKFVPTTPGRHVISEMDGIMALNAATYRIDHHVRFIILDDAILVAKRQRRRNNADGEKLVAERCWPLNEMLVLDTKDTATMTNVFKIRHGKETHVYRTEIAADKKGLLAQFRHVAEELAAKKRKEREGEHQRRKSMWIGGGDRDSGAFGAGAEPMPPLPTWLADLAGKADMGPSGKEKAERDARWIGDFSDDLTVAIALREWDDAVALVEKGEAKLSEMPALSAKLNPLKASLTAALLQALSIPDNRKSAVVQLISLLLRLKAGAAARNTFLASRADVMRKRVRMIRLEGHIGMYIADLAIVMFTGIKHTADWYLASFKENEAASCFVEWAKQQIELYAEMFRRQVYSSDIDQEVIEEAIKITHMQSRKLLEEYGIDFRFLLDELLVEKPKEPGRPASFPAPSQPQKREPPAKPRSPAPIIASPAPRSGIPPVPPIPSSAALASKSQGPRSGTPSAASARSATPPSVPESVLRVPRPVRGSPAPPPRSRDRPGSAAGGRPAPVAVPKREGMF
ncbi:hypothetical protein OBBRIDRAFT_776799 [Obba rivulosa]|uniref:Exocyst complex component EXO84 n=1 Tax=Obba rivulosa TaxID=1052685 RepID=A0A8E2ATA1_9APHY|nr:hypothetical protein OBBRIDRAFT_776799 [Obba rivulosa]